MSYKIIAIPNFKRQIKKLQKKYPSLKSDFTDLIESLTVKPEQGVSLGNHNFKIRMSISSKGRGKSGGARVITHIYLAKSTVYLLSIYDKSSRESISDKDLSDLLKHIPK